MDNQAKAEKIKLKTQNIEIDAYAESLMQRVSVDGSTWLGNGMWKRYSLDVVCLSVEQWLVQKRLGLIGNNEPQILYDIIDVSFPVLQILNIENNKIYSLQPLLRMRLPSLTNLETSRNQIASIKCLRKFNIPKLKRLECNGNFIIEYDFLTEINAYQLKAIYNEGQKVESQQEYCNWAVKMDTRLNFGITLRSKKRIEKATRGLLILKDKISQNVNFFET